MDWLALDRSCAVSLTRQLYRQLREAILSGRLQSGERLSSTRELAGCLNVSRNIVIDAFEQLQAEGYLVGRHGSGVYVEERLFLPGPDVPPSQPSLLAAAQEGNKSGLVDFRSGLPWLEAFPQRKWGRMLKEVCESIPTDQWSYGAAEGTYELRNALVTYLRRNRGVVCRPEHIIITAGAVQALAVASRALLSTPAPVLIEDPANKDVARIFSLAGGTMLPVGVDRHGLVTAQLPQGVSPAFTFVTPSHQFPVGGHLPVQRRVELVQFSRNTRSFIIEDDYDSEFRYRGSPISSLQGLAPDRVIYVGSFSKSLFPALRLGCLVVPDELIEKCREIKRLTDMQCPALEQFAMARFIAEGHFARHITKMRKIYKAKRDLLLGELHACFGPIECFGDSTGMHVVVRFPGKVFDQSLLAACRKKGVVVYPVEEHALIKGNYSDHVILGYGHLDPALISEGVSRLEAALR